MNEHFGINIFGKFLVIVKGFQIDRMHRLDSLRQFIFRERIYNSLMMQSYISRIADAQSFTKYMFAMVGMPLMKIVVTSMTPLSGLWNMGML